MPPLTGLRAHAYGFYKYAAPDGAAALISTNERPSERRPPHPSPSGGTFEMRPQRLVRDTMRREFLRLPEWINGR